MQISWVLSENERDRRFNKLKKISFRNNLTTSGEIKEEPISGEGLSLVEIESLKLSSQVGFITCS